MAHRLWHPFANMAAVAGNEFVIERAERAWLYDTDGRRYLDATASLWYSNIGHGDEEVVGRIADQLRRLDAYSIFVDLANPPALELADRLAELSPLDDARVFLTSGGGEAIDTAAKLARAYWVQRGEPRRTHLIGRVHGYHGTNGIGTSIGGIEDNRVGWGPLVGATSLIEHDSVDALEREILARGPESVAAFFCEPVMGAGGVRLPSQGYLEGVADLCEQYGVLLVVDSVICAFGRLGTWFGIERWPGIEPDMIAFAKAVTGGYMPLGGVVVSGEIAEPFWTGDGAPFRHGPTYAGHPACCAAGLATLDVLGRDGLLQRGRELEGDLAAVLAPLAGHDHVGEVRAGLGLLGAVELAPAVLEADPAAVARVTQAARDGGILVRPLGRSVAVSPPLTVGQPELELIGDVLLQAFDALEGAGATR